MMVSLMKKAGLATAALMLSTLAFAEPGGTYQFDKKGAHQFVMFKISTWVTAGCMAASMTSMALSLWMLTIRKSSVQATIQTARSIPIMPSVTSTCAVTTS